MSKPSRKPTSKLRKGLKWMMCRKCKKEYVAVPKRAAPGLVICHLCAAPPPVSEAEVDQAARDLFERNRDRIWVEEAEIPRRPHSVVGTYVCIGWPKPNDYELREDETHLILEATQRLLEKGEEGCFRDNDGILKIPVRIPEDERRK